MSRGVKGYGFDVRGHNPVYVSSVEPGQNTDTLKNQQNICVLHHHDVIAGEAAQQADIKVGDAVVMVDDTDVMRANAELVQHLIA